MRTTREQKLLLAAQKTRRKIERELGEEVRRLTDRARRLEHVRAVLR